LESKGLIASTSGLRKMLYVRREKEEKDRSHQQSWFRDDCVLEMISHGRSYTETILSPPLSSVCVYAYVCGIVVVWQRPSTTRQYADATGRPGRVPTGRGRPQSAQN